MDLGAIETFLAFAGTRQFSSVDDVSRILNAARSHLERLGAYVDQRRSAGVSDPAAEALLSRLSELFRTASELYRAAPGGFRSPDGPGGGNPLIRSAGAPREDGGASIALSDITGLQQIGGGVSGVVFSGCCHGQQVAVKVSKVERWTEAQRTGVQREISILRKVQHPNVAQFLGVTTFPDGRPAIVSELLGEDLEAIIFKRPERNAITIERKLRVLRDAALGCNWLHSLNLIHRDLKLPNLLIDEFGRVKITDFGLSEFHRGSSRELSPKGTPLYEAPEVLLCQLYDKSIDVYAFGMICAEIMWEQQLFPLHQHKGDITAFIEAVAKGGERPAVPEMITQTTEERRRVIPPQRPPNGFVDLVQRCWSQDPKARPTFMQILDDIDSILISATIADDNARQWWVRRFNHPIVRMEVDWSTFSMAICEETSASPQQLDNIRPFICAKETDRHKLTESVTMRMFNFMVQWFGPFYGRDYGFLLINDIIQLLNRPWFHWDVRDKQAADRRLHGREDGTFLIRPSFTDPSRWPFTLSLNYHNHTEHIHVTKSDQFRIQTSAGLLAFRNFDDLIRTQSPGDQRNILNLIYPCDHSIEIPRYLGY